MKKNDNNVDFNLNIHENSGCAGKRAGLFFGLLVTLAGLFLLASNLGWVDSQIREVVFSWQMLFMVAATVFFFQRIYSFASFWFVLGLFFLLPKIAEVYPDALPWVDSDFSANYWPVLIILLGLVMIYKLFFGKSKFWQMSGKNFASNTVAGVDGVYNRTVAFGGAEDVFLEPVFRGGKISMAFGGVGLDLRKTTLPEGDTYLKIEVAFGGLDVRVPDDWKVISEVDVAFGDMEISRKNKSQTEIDNSRRLIVKGQVVFGGAEIR